LFGLLEILGTSSEFIDFMNMNSLKEKPENYLFLELSRDHFCENKGCLIKTGNQFELRYSYGNLTPLTTKNCRNRFLIILGHPSYNNKINNDEFIQNYVSNKHKLSEINGEFLIIDFNTENDELNVINSRFASPIVFYASFNDRILLSTSYSIIFKKLINEKLAKINSAVFYELMRFRRLFCDHTYDSASKYLAPASNLKWNGKLTTSNYWKHNYEKNGSTLIENAALLNDLG